MIRCLYTSIERRWTKDELLAKIAVLPAEMQEHILAKRHWTDRQLSAAGKLLVPVAFEGMYGKAFSWKDIQYNSWKRPFLPDNGDFNISHSGNVVICAATDKGKIGIDLEKVRRIDPDDYLDFFNASEWRMIRGAEHPEQQFFHFWTRKEAVIKAIGCGMYNNLPALDVRSDRVSDGDSVYYLREVFIAGELPCHVASTAAIEGIELLLTEI